MDQIFDRHLIIASVWCTPSSLVSHPMHAEHFCFVLCRYVQGLQEKAFTEQNLLDPLSRFSFLDQASRSQSGLLALRVLTIAIGPWCICFAAAPACLRSCQRPVASSRDTPPRQSHQPWLPCQQWACFCSSLMSGNLGTSQARTASC